MSWLTGMSEALARLKERVAGGVHMEKYEVLRRSFGYDRFQPGQRELIDAVLSGRDVLGIMPTGGGKSLCYQIPALMLEGLTLVICPLIALMQDQVAALQKSGIRAVCLHSGLSQQEYQDTLRAIGKGEVRMLYVSPERLENSWFASFLRGKSISLVAVDEAHCISQWGKDFRPSYRNISAFVESLPRRPVIAAFTATATERVREDIRTLLKLKNPRELVMGFDRPNLYFEVRQPADKMTALLNILFQHENESGIIYCSTRSNVERLCDALMKRGIEAVRYHAGLSEEERQANQEAFLSDRRQLMVATSAFGMGIDKPNVRFVIHYNLPLSLEAYYQEAGRAGRDGEPAECILLYALADIGMCRYLISHGRETTEDPELRENLRLQAEEQLNTMILYCQTDGCLRSFLLNHFGETAPERCENCGNCAHPVAAEDITVQAQMILSCVKRIYSRLHYYVGAELLIRVLRGSEEKRVQELGLKEIQTYGIMKDLSRERVRACLDALLEQGYLFQEPEHRTLRPTASAGDVLFRDKKVTMRTRPEPEETPGRGGPFRLRAPEEQLARELKRVRARLAQEERISAGKILSDRTLDEMARLRPRTMAELLEVPGMEERQARQYGKAFLRAIGENAAAAGKGG